MSLRNNNKKNYFVTILHGNRRENHKVLINERIFNLNDINKWKLYLKPILQYVNYLCEIYGKDINLLLQEVGKEINDESKEFKHRMSFLLGDWSDY